MKTLRVLLVFVLLVLLLPVLPVAAQEPAAALPDGCTLAPLPSGAVALVCMPTAVPWNNDLVMFAHGYVAEGREPTAFIEEQLVLDGQWVPGLVNAMGYAFAATSYRANGLVVKYGVDDLTELYTAFSAVAGIPSHTYLVGVSEGGLIATQAIERNPGGIFTGGLACCGPVGDFPSQMNYFGDFRVVFDYFFPGMLKPYGGDAMHVPDALIADFENVVVKVAAALAARPAAAKQLISVTKAAVDPAVPETLAQTVRDVLVYNIFATNNAVRVLEGIPFNNKDPLTWYYGSSNDLLLNSKVARFKADADALAEMNTYYQTTGRLNAPLVTMHTTSDPVVPYWHELLYQVKTLKSKAALKHLNIPIVRYGHCAFTASELIFGFGLLVLRSTGAWPAGIEQSLPTMELRQQFEQLKLEQADVVRAAVR